MWINSFLGLIIRYWNKLHGAWIWYFSYYGTIIFLFSYAFLLDFFHKKINLFTQSHFQKNIWLWVWWYFFLLFFAVIGSFIVFFEYVIHKNIAAELNMIHISILVLILHILMIAILYILNIVYLSVKKILYNNLSNIW